MKNISAPIVLRRLNTIGYKEAPNEPARRFAQWSFLYLISGEVLTHTGSDSVLCASHDVLLVPPGTEFRVLWYKDSVGYFGGFEESSLLGRTLPLLRATVPVKVRIPYSDEIFADELMEYLSRHLQEPELAASSLDLLLRILRTGSSEGSSICRVFLDDVFCGAPVLDGPSDFAARQGISEADLNREVKEETGRTAGEWIAISRLSLAKLYLKDPSLSMAEVSEKTGIEDQSYFARFFKKHEGVTPSQYRNDILKKS